MKECIERINLEEKLEEVSSYKYDIEDVRNLLAGKPDGYTEVVTKEDIYDILEGKEYLLKDYEQALSEISCLRAELDSSSGRSSSTLSWGLNDFLSSNVYFRDLSRGDLVRFKLESEQEDWSCELTELFEEELFRRLREPMVEYSDKEDGGNY